MRSPSPSRQLAFSLQSVFGVLMQGSLPLPRIINGVLQPSASRIPHLVLHILNRQTRSSPRPRPQSTCTWPAATKYATFSLRTYTTHRLIPDNFSSSSSSSSLSPLLDEEDNTLFTFTRDQQQAAPAVFFTPDLELDGEEDGGPNTSKLVSMDELLNGDNLDRILLGFVTPHIGDVFVASADDKTFEKAICLLDPDYFIEPYRNLHHHLKPTLETEPRFRYVKSLEERIQTFIHILERLVSLRKENGHAVSLPVYRHILRCAAASGNGNLARYTFRNVMPEENIIPDLECYNYFMEALNWNHAYSRYERYNLRVTRFSLLRRGQEDRPKKFLGHGVATPSDPTSEESIRLEALRIFSELVRQGHSGNESTFCNLMVAMGREGDIASVKSVLKSVWNVDVDALGKYDEEEIESPRYYEADSPLRPTGRLLFTVVHIFGSNNEVAVATMLLDYLSRNYNLEIPENVWTHVLEWSFVLACQRQNWKEERGFAVGRVSFDAIENLYSVFHSEPYNVPPKIVDLMYRAKIRRRRHILDIALEDIRECMRLLDDDRTRLSILYDKMRKYIFLNYPKMFNDGVAAPGFLRLRRAFVLTSLQADCHLQLISIWVRNALKNREWPGGGWQVEWSYRRLPKLVEEFKDYLPDTLPYYTPTGHVVLLGKDHRNRAILSENSAQMTRTGSMRAMFDTHSPARLRHAADFVHRGSGGLHSFNAEVDMDVDSARVDWVLRKEQAGRTTRLKTRHYGRENPPSGDYRADEWQPWPRSKIRQGQAQVA